MYIGNCLNHERIVEEKMTKEIYDIRIQIDELPAAKDCIAHCEFYDYRTEPQPFVSFIFCCDRISSIEDFPSGQYNLTQKDFKSISETMKINGETFGQTTIEDFLKHKYRKRIKYLKILKKILVLAGTSHNTL